MTGGPVLHGVVIGGEKMDFWPTPPPFEILRHYTHAYWTVDYRRYTGPHYPRFRFSHMWSLSTHYKVKDVWDAQLDRHGRVSHGIILYPSNPDAKPEPTHNEYGEVCP